MNNFQLTHEKHGFIEVVHMAGALDMNSFSRVEDFCTKEFQQRHYAVLLDCKEVDYFSSIGIGVLVGLAKQFRKHGGDLKLVNVTKRVHNVLEVLGFTKVLEICNTEEVALASFAAR